MYFLHPAKMGQPPTAKDVVGNVFNVYLSESLVCSETCHGYICGAAGVLFILNKALRHFHLL